jgi:putative peptidoglycan lipid II flippase
VLRHGIGTLIFLNLFSAILLIVLAHPIVRLLFERGQFSIASTNRATVALMCLAPGLIAFSTVNIVGRAFFALGDTKTPMKISIFCLALNVVLAASMVNGLRQGGLGIANTTTSVCNASLLLYALRKRLGKLEMETLLPTFLPLAIAGIVAGLIAWFGLQTWEQFVGHRSLAAKAGAVFVPATIAGIGYWVIAVLGKVPAPKEITDLILQKVRGRER